MTHVEDVDAEPLLRHIVFTLAMSCNEKDLGVVVLVMMK